MCGDRVETVSHIAAECTSLAQNQYKSWRHRDKVAQVIHWDLSEKCDFERELNWYDHKPKPVCESERYKLLWDCPFDTRIDSKEKEKKLRITIGGFGTADQSWSFL